MPKRKQEEEDDDDVVDLVDDDDDDDYKGKSKKKAKAPAKAPAARKTPSKSKAPAEPYVDNLGWNIHPPSLIYRDWGTQGSAKIAAFDLDGTLVNQKSGARFPTTADDWKWYNKKTANKVKEFADHGYKIVIFTNQGGIKSKLEGPMADKVKGRITNIVDKLGVPVQAFAATLEDEFRKPEAGMWNFFKDNHNGGIKIDMKNSFFVGDAAGRPTDFADSDKQFAAAIGLPFKLPEDVFGEMEGKKALPPVTLPEGASSANEALALCFTQLADYWFGKGERYKAIAFQKAGKALAAYPVTITKSNFKEAGKLPGVGKASLAMVEEFVNTGKLTALEAVQDGGADADAGAAPSSSSKAAKPAGAKPAAAKPASEAFKFM